MVGIGICLLMSQNQGFFAKSYGTTRWDYCFSVIGTQDNGYAMSGYSGGFLDNGNFLVIKTDSAGSLVWAYEYYQDGFSYDEFAWPIVQATDGGYYVGGHGFVDAMSSSNDIVLLKIGSDGAVQWAKSYGNDPYNIDYSHTMVRLSDGGLVIAGHGEVSPLPTGQDAIVIKINPTGSVVWAKQYADVNQEHLYGVIQTTDGGIVAVGFTVRSGSSDFDILVIRLDGFGNPIWIKSYGAPGVNDFGYAAAQLNDGDIVVAAYMAGVGGGLMKIRLSDGTLLWTKASSSVGLDYFYRPQMTKTSDGGVVLTAFTTSFGSGQYDFLILKFGSDGELLWAKTFGGANYDLGTCAFEKPDGRLIIAGMTQSYGVGGNNDFALLVTQPDGTFPGACVWDCSPSFTSPALSTYTLGSLSDWPHIERNLTYARTDPGVVVTHICDPLYESEDEHPTGPGFSITCRPFPGGTSFFSPEAMDIRIYEVDGKLAFSGQLQVGENRITLERGVYFWITGSQSGRVAVR